MSNPMLQNAVDQWLASRLALRQELRMSLGGGGSENVYLIEDPIRSKFFQIGKLEFEFISLIDGRRSVSDIIALINDRADSERINSESAFALYQWLLQSRLLQTSSPSDVSQIGDAARRMDFQRKLAWLNPISFRVPLLNPSRILDRLSPAGRWLFSPWFIPLWFATVIMGLYVLATNWARFRQESIGILADGRWFWLIACYLVLKIVHELAHGLACKKYGGDVRTAGVLMLLFVPLAFVDVTTSWRFRSRWQRIVVAAAGMYVELLIALAAVIYWSYQPTGLWSDVAYNIFVMAGITTILFNANPLMRFDGYYILADSLGIVNLYSKGQAWFRSATTWLIFGTPHKPAGGSPRERTIVAVYGIASFVWRILLSLSILLTAATLFDGAGVILAAIGAVFWIGMPVYFQIKSLFFTPARNQIQPRRVVMSVITSIVLVAAGIFLLSAPALKSAPAIVSYKDEQILRAASDGFYEQIMVENGQLVETGQLLVTLVNTELQLELERIDSDLQIARLRSRLQQSEGRIADYQSTLEEIFSLKEQLAEKKSQVDRMMVRAPIDGYVFRPQLGNLLGSFVAQGDSIVSVAPGNEMEVQVSIGQADLPSVRQNVGRFVKVLLPGTATIEAKMDRLNPRASNQAPDPSLCVSAGGSLPVRPRKNNDDEDDSGGYELLSPRFTATIALDPQSSPEVRAGQRGQVLFRSTRESLASYLYLSARNWIKNKLAAGTSPL